MSPEAAASFPLPLAGEGARRAGEGAGVHGIAEIGFALRDDATRLSHLYQHDPLRVLFPRAAAGDLPTAAVVTTSGGLVAGDRIEVRVRLGAGAAAHVTAAAADKIYRSVGPTTRVDQFFSLDPGARLEFLPQETILFDSARLRRRTMIELAPGAGFLGGGILVFGRRERGEAFTRGVLREVWEVWRGGRLTWGDALMLDGDIAAVMADPACFDNAAACATLLLAPPAGNASRLLDGARAVLAQSAAPGLRSGGTIVAGLLIARWLAPDPWALRRAYADLACHLRVVAMGLPPRLPALWHV